MFLLRDCLLFSQIVHRPFRFQADGHKDEEPRTVDSAVGPRHDSGEIRNSNRLEIGVGSEECGELGALNSWHSRRGKKWVPQQKRGTLIFLCLLEARPRGAGELNTYINGLCVTVRPSATHLS